MDKLNQGQQISERYTLKSRLSLGGVGEVWLATDSIRQQDLALKFLHPSLTDKPSARELLSREFEQAQRLIHPNIVRVLALENFDGRLFLVSEFKGEKTADDLKPGDYRQFLPILLPVVDALTYGHATGLLHRDIKPSNIILDTKGNAFLTDFGLSLNLDSKTDLSGGSLFYMSPQQLAGESLDPRDDIYSFGATLYELINGHPPFYPSVTPDLIRNETPKPLKSKITLPAGLDELIFALLSKNREDRPPSFAEVRDRLISFTDVPDQSTTPPDNVVVDQVRPIEVAKFPSPGGTTEKPLVNTSKPTDKRHKTVPLGLGLTALAVAVIVVGLVVFLLPKFAPKISRTVSANKAETNEPMEQTAVATEKPVQPEKRAPYEEAKFQREREDAKNFTLALLRQQMALEEKKVAIWAGEEYTQAQDLADAGDDLFREEDFEAAMQSYRDAEKILKQLDERSAGVLQEVINKGQDAIAAGDAEAARKAFEVALTIQPKNAAAVSGLKLADALPKIHQLLAVADTKYQSGQLAGAKKDYDEVLKLQPNNTIALQARQQINTRLSGISFDKAMSEGFAALETQDFSAARSAFDQAKKLRPNAQGPKDGLAQVDLSIKGNDIEGYRTDAKILESEEKWRDASTQYQAVLDLDDTLVFAKQGKFRSLARARLHDQLDSYITRSDRLSDPKTYSLAQDVLKQANSLPRKGPVLRKQIDTVTGLIKVARIPVRVRLESDNLTNVVMFKVGRLGSFQSHELELIPGTYTVVGTRSGYRDVRQNVVVSPGSEPPAVFIRCEDKI